MSEPSAIISRHSRSFSLAAKFLPQSIRGDVVSLYAWCRTIDDAVDLEHDPQVALRKLDAFKRDVHAVTRGEEPSEEETHWIARLIRSSSIDPRHAIELIEGMEMDARGDTVRTDGDLRRYCYHAAGTVGLMMARLMGVTDPTVQKHAAALGIAMQMTNIARDVREDALNGRSYLPRIDRPLSVASNESIAETKRVLKLAEQQYQFGLAGIQCLPAACRPAIRVAAAVYQEIGREILRQSCPVLERRVVLPRWRIAVVATRAILSPRILFPSKGNLMSKQARTTTVTSQVMQARSSVCLGLSLTAIMAAVLFVLVYVNPKDSSYGLLPLAYSAVSLVFAVVMNRLSARYEEAGSDA